MPEVKLKPVSVDGVASTGTEVIAVGFDIRVLRVTVEFRPTRDWVYIDFSFPRGFRVLDEGDLVEYWRAPHAQESFLFEVESGGWLDLEAQRSGFVSTQRKDVTEYLVAGEEACVSVLAIERPHVAVCK